MKKISVYIDESYSDGYASVAAIAVQGEDSEQTVRAAFKKLALKPEFISTSKGVLHYQEENVSARQVMSSFIRQIPVSAYLAFTRLDVPTDKGGQDDLVYGELLPRLLKAVLQKYQKHGMGYLVEVIFENLSDQIEKDRGWFESKMSLLSSQYDFEITVATKETETLLCLPDYFLGFVRDVVLSPQNQTWQYPLFELIADKFGVILEYGDEIKRYNRGEGVNEFLCAYRGK